MLRTSTFSLRIRAEIHQQIGVATFDELIAAGVHFAARGFLEVATERSLDAVPIRAERMHESVGLVALQVRAGRGVGADGRSRRARSEDQARRGEGQQLFMGLLRWFARIFSPARGRHAWDIGLIRANGPSNAP